MSFKERKLLELQRKHVTATECLQLSLFLLFFVKTANKCVTDMSLDAVLSVPSNNNNDDYDRISGVYISENVRLCKLLFSGWSETVSYVFA